MSENPSDSVQIKDRPYPFEVKTALFQLWGLAITTPKDVADISLEYSGLFDQIQIRVYVGGYDPKRNDQAQLTEAFYVDHHTAAGAVKKIQEMIEKINAACADGRKIKAKRIRDEAAALLKQAEEIEAAGLSQETATQP